MGGIAPTLAMSALKMGMETAQQRSTADNQAEQIKTARNASQLERQKRLKRALATQRARFAAQGISSGQSSEAALRGYVDEAKREAASEEQMAELRIDRLQDQSDWSRRRNLLQLASPIKRSGSSLLQRGIGGLSLFDD